MATPSVVGSSARTLCDEGVHGDDAAVVNTLLYFEPMHGSYWLELCVWCRMARVINSEDFIAHERAYPQQKLNELSRENRGFLFRTIFEGTISSTMRNSGLKNGTSTMSRPESAVVAFFIRRSRSGCARVRTP